MSHQQMLTALRRTTRSWRSHLQAFSVIGQCGLFSTSVPCSGLKLTEYAYEIFSSNVRFGLGATREVGLDCKNLKARHVCVVTDRTVTLLDAVKVTLQSLQQAGVQYTVYDNVHIEPSDESFKDAIQFAREGEFDAFVAVGGGSVIETCKVANLYSSNPCATFLDYVNAPIGLGRAVARPVKPLIAVPTTAGTGSEVTGTATFDYLKLKTKAGIFKSAMRPSLAIVDPLHLRTVPERVAAYSGLDVLCHAMEGLTCQRYSDRYPRPDNPSQRPSFQGGNPVSDVWCKQALNIVAKYLNRAVWNADDLEARSEMLLAGCLAGMGSGNAGLHLCHAMGCPISSLVRDFVSKDYDPGRPMVPHGLAVAVTAPAVFSFTAAVSPERHLEIAECLGADVRGARRADAGRIVSDVLRQVLYAVQCPDGLSALGYSQQDIPALVQATLPQHRMTSLSPRLAGQEDYAHILLHSLTIY